MGAMSPSPLKIVVKLRKPDAGVNSNDQAAEGKGDVPRKKRKRPADGEAGSNVASKRPTTALSPKPDSELVPKRPATIEVPKLKDGQALPGGPPRPRFVIKGSFGNSSKAAETPSVISGSVQPPAIAEDGHRHKKNKEKKKKKHKDRTPGATPNTETQQALPAPGSLPKHPAKVKPTPAGPGGSGHAVVENEPLDAPAIKQEVKQDVSQDIKNTEKQEVKQEAKPTLMAPPAKPPPVRPAQTVSQAPSGLTGLSGDGGFAVNSRLAGPQATSGQEASSAHAKQEHRPGAGDVERLLNRLQRKDPYQIFKDPVTDAVAPGYSQAIKRPMSFAQMRSRLEKGEYTTWDLVQKDLETMFNNAMVFNGPTTPYHQKAREMMGISRKLLLQLRTTGQFDARGRKPGSVAKAPAAAAPQPQAAAPSGTLAEKRPERRGAAMRAERALRPKVDKKKLAAKKNAQRAAASGILARPNFEDGRGDLGPLSAEENVRATYLPLLGTALEQQWKGLAKGASGSGVAFSSGRPTLRANFAGPLPLEAYKKSLERFGAKLGRRAKLLLSQKIVQASKVPEPKPAALPIPGARPFVPSTQNARPNPGTTIPQASWNLLSQSRPVIEPFSGPNPAQPLVLQSSLPGVAASAQLPQRGRMSQPMQQRPSLPGLPGNQKTHHQSFMTVSQGQQQLRPAQNGSVTQAPPPTVHQNASVRSWNNVLIGQTSLDTAMPPNQQQQAWHHRPPSSTLNPHTSHR